jgi:hypothetical protein
LALVPKDRRNDKKRHDRVEQLLETLDLKFTDLTELAKQAADRVGIITKARITRARRLRVGTKRERRTLLKKAPG